MQEAQVEALLQEMDIDLLVLARYMQIFSEDFCSRHAKHTINIHHSFLPAFEGGTHDKLLFWGPLPVASTIPSPPECYQQKAMLSIVTAFEGGIRDCCIRAQNDGLWLAESLHLSEYHQ